VACNNKAKMNQDRIFDGSMKDLCLITEKKNRSNGTINFLIISQIIYISTNLTNYMHKKNFL
jgi:hypothetical protein